MMDSSSEDIVKEEFIFLLDPGEIKVHEDLPRVRQDLGELENLLASFEKYGQMQPVVINRNMELIAGGRRLAACLLGNRKVRVCFSDAVDPLLMRELELEENLQRKALTPSEEVLAVDEIHRLKRQIHGEAVSGKQDSGWTIENTASIIGKTRFTVHEDLRLAEAIKMFPSLSECKTKSDIKKAVKSMERVSQRIDALTSYETSVANSKIPFTVVQAEATEHMAGMPNASVDLLLTDPPYGIEIDKLALGLGGVTGGMSSAGFKYSDSKIESLDLINKLAVESYRFCKKTAHAFVFVGPEHFWTVSMLFQAAGWNVCVKPLIWIKRETGQNNAPHAWPSSAYEMILYARRVDSAFILEGRPDWMQFDPVPVSAKVHQAEKPIALLKELISRAVLPGSIIYDPFMGSGATIEAALDMKSIPTGCDQLLECYATTLHRITEWDKRRK